MDNFRRDDKESFSALYNAIQDVRKSCDELRRFALIEPDLVAQSSLTLGSSEDLEQTAKLTAGNLASSQPSSSFLNEISSSSAETFLELLTQIRTNQDYLGTRLCALSSSELSHFIQAHKGVEPFESVLPSATRSTTRSASASTRHGINDVERLLSFQRHDPLSILIHTCFANSAGPEGNEDQRRLDIWASALAKLISEPKSNSEQFLVCVFNNWVMMRDWSGKSNLEWYLMKILSDGAFLLDRAEDQHGTRFNMADWTQTDEAAAKEFYDRSVSELFELIDDEDATGIPDGLLELGGAVLNKLEGKYVENTSKWLVWRCLFFVFFLGVIVHPETHGMLPEYYITPYAREKILKKVAMKAYEYVSSMWSTKPLSTAVQVVAPDHVKSHIERILSRFNYTSNSIKPTRLLPARSATSLKENTEVQPFLVICPSDISTLVNSLFPERRPLSANSSGWRSVAPSISGISTLSQPISMVNTRNSLDAGSVLSTSLSSVFSDGPHDSSSKTIPDPYVMRSADSEAQRKMSKYEDDGYKLRLALHELSRNLGPEAIRGSCHPCADRWNVLFISEDGKKITSKMAYDAEFDALDQKSTWESGSEAAADDAEDLGFDEHQIREAVLKLLEDFEIPQTLESETEPEKLTYRASRLKTYSSRESDRRTRNAVGALPKEALNGMDAEYEHAEPVLIAMLRAASAQAEAQSDFISSHLYWNTLKQLQRYLARNRDAYSTLINELSSEPSECIEISAAAIDDYDAWLVWLKQSQQRLESSINQLMKRTRSTRDKMWYIADVRNSTEYTWSKDVCQALKFMGMPHRWGPNKRRATGPAYMFSAESQVIDVVAATEKLGGPNKLTDEQSDMTKLWLQQCGIENFCQGEERIHRFCCEIDKCINKLVGETIREAPVLWSSDLYKRDKALYDRLKSRDREKGWAADDASSIISDSESIYNSGLRNHRPGSRDLRSANMNGNGHHSPDVGRSLHIRGAVPLSSVLSGQRSFDRTSPVHAVDSISAFWSPFQATSSPASRAYSPTSSMTNLSTPMSGLAHQLSRDGYSSTSTGRPGTSASSNETLNPRYTDDDKTQFLSELKQSLTGLLLSDLGSFVIAKGSETDIWFQGLGQECIARKDALDQHALRKSALKDNIPTPVTGKPRTLGKKKSFDNLRSAGDNAGDDSGSNASKLSRSSRDSQNSGRQSATVRGLSSEFPYKKAYQRLLSMLSVHPNPYHKLHVLRELEQLIIAAESSSRRRSKRTGHSAPATGGDAKGMSSKPSTVSDVVIEELVKIFRDCSLRPKSIFRDLQLIAAHVPASILDRQETGRAFWNAGVAAMKLKAEVCRTMIEMADEVFAAHTHARNSTYTEDDQEAHVPSSTGTPPPPSTKYKLQDVGRMWSITAKEGYPTAQRELALFYLSNPESVERVILPLSKPKEVFKQTVMDKFGRAQSTGGSGSNGVSGAGNNASKTGGADSFGGTESANKPKDVRNDPGLMCVAVHWMEAAERGGDELAISFLRQNEFMGRT